MIPQTEILLYSQRHHCILKTTRYNCTSLEKKNSVAFEIIMEIILWFGFTLEFFGNTVSHIIGRCI